MYTIALSGLRFYAPIGVYQEERVLKNEIEINLSVTKKPESQSDKFIDYEIIYRIVKKEAEEEETLLENLIERIQSQIKSIFPETILKIEIRKLHPPFIGEINYAAVSWSD